METCRQKSAFGIVTYVKWDKQLKQAGSLAQTNQCEPSLYQADTTSARFCLLLRNKVVGQNTLLFHNKLVISCFQFQK